METPFRHVYFRIRTGYEWGKGWSQQEHDLFNEEILKVFAEDGWVRQEKNISSSSCETVIKGKENLYLHPMEFTGIVSLENIPHIEQMLSNGKTFKHYHTDVYDEVFDISDDEYLEILKNKKDQIIAEILAAYKTKRRNLFIQVFLFVIK